MDMKSLKIRSSTILAVAASMALLGATFGATAWAVGIKGHVAAAPSRAFKPSNPINISKGTGAWVYYGYNGQTDGMNTDASNVASFSALNCPTLSAWTSGPAPAYVTFTGANNGPSNNFVFVNGPFSNGNGGGQSGNKFSFTSKLIAPSETLRVYLISFDSKSDLSVSLSSGGSVVSKFHKDVVLPTRDGDGTGANHGYGILTLKVKGKVGEVLTVTDATNISGVSSTGNANVGIQAASVTAHG
ncbi:MAG: hypothetical protein ACP5I8_05590 [Phycisphaerae bacterium]